MTAEKTTPSDPRLAKLMQHRRVRVGDPNIQSNAVQRYIDDEAAAIEHRNIGLAKRASRPDAVLVSAMARVLATIHRAIVENDQRLDDAALSIILHLIGKGYSQVTGFAASFLLGPVGPRFAKARFALCTVCSWLSETGHCKARRAGRGCGCPVHWWWPFSRQTFRVWLRGQTCPIGRFGLMSRFKDRGAIKGSHESRPPPNDELGPTDPAESAFPGGV